MQVRRLSQLHCHPGTRTGTGKIATKKSTNQRPPPKPLSSTSTCKSDQLTTGRWFICITAALLPAMFHRSLVNTSLINYYKFIHWFSGGVGVGADALQLLSIPGSPSSMRVSLDIKNGRSGIRTSKANKLQKAKLLQNLPIFRYVADLNNINMLITMS